jgi:hypothetical protein
MKGLLLLIGSFLLVSCASLPVIRPPVGLAEKTFTCPSPYPTEKIRFIHAIEVRAAEKAQTVMIGVTLMDPSMRTISCALMSAEGMALFEAAAGPDGLTVSRALPPFDAPDFARSMMDDIELIFLAPREAVIEKGVLAGGQSVCRRHKEQGGWIDVLTGRDGNIEVRRYSNGGGLLRSVMLAGGAQNPYSAIELQASELVNYSLVMTLIEAEAVKDEPPLRK